MIDPRSELTSDEMIRLLGSTLSDLRPRRFVSVDSPDDAFTDHVNFDDGSVLRVHPRSVCTPPCAIHEPSDHPLRDAPTQWRADARLIERVCPHGVGHPDLDQVQFEVKIDGGRWLGIHGCDGCCTGEGPE